MFSSSLLIKLGVTLAGLCSTASAFDASSNKNVALYWGQASAGSQESLATYCESDAADIMILSFISSFPGTDNIPTLNFAAACSETFSSGLLKCDQIATDIQTCQSLGKKVLLSMGGSAGSYGFSSDSEAEEFAGTLWNLFGEGSADERPFGDAVVDGFDFDIESNDDVGYAALATKLRSYFTEGTKTYYLSAAPQCVYPDASVGDALSNAEFDFAFIQFYNNYCSIGSSFNWDTWVEYAQNTSPNKDIKLYLGLPGSTSAAGSGYVDIDTIKTTLATIGDDANFGGVMLWDASQGFTNTVDGEAFVEAIKDALNELSGTSDATTAATETSQSAATTSTTSSSTSTSSTTTLAAVTSTTSSSTSVVAPVVSTSTTSSTTSTPVVSTSTSSSTSSTSVVAPSPSTSTSSSSTSIVAPASSTSISDSAVAPVASTSTSTSIIVPVASSSSTSTSIGASTALSNTNVVISTTVIEKGASATLVTSTSTVTVGQSSTALETSTLETSAVETSTVETSTFAATTIDTTSVETTSSSASSTSAKAPKLVTSTVIVQPSGTARVVTKILTSTSVVVISPVTSTSTVSLSATSTPATSTPAKSTSTTSTSTFVEVTSNTFTTSVGSTLRTVVVSFTSTTTSTASASSTSTSISGCDTLTGSDKSDCLNAQYLAGQFAGSPDTCTHGQTACSSDGSYAVCNWGTWVVQACAAGTTCYAVPVGDEAFVSCNWPQN